MQHTSINGLSLVIMGDSYSTFEGHVPAGYYTYYPGDSVPSVDGAEKTWWYQFVKQHELKLIRNDSWSGSTVSNTLRPGLPYESSFLRRMEIAIGPGVNPDLIVILGGTNDNWLNNPHGSVKFADWTEEDDMQTLPAFCHLFAYAKEHNPKARIVCVLNLPFHEALEQGLPEACRHFGIECIALQDVDKENGHPTAKGMTQIAQQIGAALA